MCTVTIVPCRAGNEWVRLACNRDELHARRSAWPPQVRRFGKHRALLPIDPASGGTWVASTDAGLALGLLNVNPANGSGRTERRLLSRGLIIPALLHCDSLATAIEQAMTLGPTHYAPFRLVLVERQQFAEVRSNGKWIRLVRCTRLIEPVLFTSSGLGDQRVAGPRRRLFAEFFSMRQDWHAQQEAFHRHHWPERSHLSVCMRRPDARTVSHTVVSLGQSTISLTYYADAPDQAVPPVSRTLDLLPGGTA